MADGGLTSVWTLFLIWFIISVITYSPPPAVKKDEVLASQADADADDSFLNTIMWLNQND